MKFFAYVTVLFFGLFCCLSFAAPEPAIVQGPDDWTLDVRFEHPQQLVLRSLQGRAVERYWYVILTLTNKAGRFVEFYPKCDLMTDTFEIIPSGRGVSEKIIEKIKSRHQLRYPFLESLEEAGNRILQGSDNARDIVITWRDFDVRANNIKLFFSGLSNETAVIEHPQKVDDSGRAVKVYLRKTLELSYTLPSDGVARSQVKLTYDGKRWVMR